jgi:hypothetical protein
VAVRAQHPPRLPAPDAGLKLKTISIKTLDGRIAAPLDQQLVDRVRGEFIEMPGFSPTLAQASRLFNLTPDECQRVLGLLIREGFLRCGPDGQYRLPSYR